MTNRKKQELYLDWVNNFLTVAYFAEYYGLTEAEANAVINDGRAYHESVVADLANA